MKNLTFSLSHSLTGSLGQAWAGWQRLARRISEFQSRLLLMVLYGLLVIPVGLVLRLVSDPLRRRRPAASNWTPRAPAPATLDEARRQ